MSGKISLEIVIVAVERFSDVVSNLSVTAGEENMDDISGERSQLSMSPVNKHHFMRAQIMRLQEYVPIPEVPEM